MSPNTIEDIVRSEEEEAEVFADRVEDIGGGIDNLIRLSRELDLIRDGVIGVFWKALERGLLSDLSRMYESETGLSPVRGAMRLKGIALCLFDNHLCLEGVELEEHNDRIWNIRTNRTNRERRASPIGSTNDQKKGYLTSMWWVLPKEAGE